MPITVLYLPCDDYSDEQIAEVANAVCLAKANVLESPIDRIRVFVNDMPMRHVSIGGQMANIDRKVAPFYETYLLEGRPASQQAAVLAAIADLLAAHLSVDISNIRGLCHMVPPSRWAIGGVPAASIRAGEIAQRASQHRSN